MSVRKITWVFALSVAAAFTQTACGGDDGAAPGSDPSHAPQAGSLPVVMDFDAREEQLRPGATVPLQVELEDAYDRDVPDPAAANVQLEIVQDDTGGARLSATQLSTRRGEANFSITLGPNLGTVILKATTDRSDNDVANGITDELSWLLGMVVTPTGNGLNWELPAIIDARSGGVVPLPEDADDGREPHRYAVNDSRFELVQCRPGDDDVCLRTSAAAGSYPVAFTVTDATGSTLSIPVTVAVR